MSTNGSVRVTTLNNGLRVATDSMPGVESIAIGVWAAVGTRSEAKPVNGVAHMLEHMAFKGTKRRNAREIAEEIEAVGGHINAYTSRESTAYYARLLADDLPLGVDILSDILQNSTFESEELERERTVILQEIGQAEDTPDDIIFDRFQETAYPDQPMGRPVLGSVETVSAMSRDALIGYMREHYTGERLVLAAAGRVDHDDLVRRVESIFAGAGGSKTSRTGAAPAARSGVDVFKRPTEQAHIMVGTEALRRGHPDRHALALLDNILGSGMSSRLFQEIRESRGLAYSVYSYRSMFADTGTFSVYAGTLPQNAETVMEIVSNEIESVVRDGITQAELERAKGNVKGSLVLSSEDPGSRMNRLGRQQVTTGEILSIDELIARFDALTMDDVRRVADTVLKDATFSIAVVGPFEEDAFDRYAA